MTLGTGRGIQLDPDPLTVEIDWASLPPGGTYAWGFKAGHIAGRTPRRRAVLRLLAAFALGLAVGLLISDTRAAPRPASQLGIPVSAEGRTGAPFRDIGVLASMPSPTRDAARPTVGEPLPAIIRSGIASYYNAGRGLYAALPGPWRSGRLVAVCAFVGGTARCATAPVVTTCGCSGPPRKVIDLSPALMERITGWTAAERRLRGVVRVSVEVLR